jgi:hypothetical protein
MVSLLYWIVSPNNLYPVAELKFAIKIFYPYIILLFLLSNIKVIPYDMLINYMLLYAVIYIISLPITFLGGLGRMAYGGSAFGVMGLVTGGNEFGLTLLMSNCLACYMFFHTSKIRYAVLHILLTIGTIMLGTVAGVFGSFGITASLILSRLFIKNYRKITKKWQRIYISVLFIIGIPLTIFMISIIIRFSEFSRMKFNAARLISGGARDWLKSAAVKNISSYSPSDFLFGISMMNFQIRNMQIMGRDEPVNIEIDQYDFIGSYGFLFGGLLLLMPVLLTIRIVITYLKKRTVLYYWMSIAMMLFLVHGFTSGHAFSVITPMQIVMVIIFCYCSNKRSYYLENNI